jgi:hypothetical protein
MAKLDYRRHSPGDITATACKAYTPYSAEVIVGGSVVTYRNTNCSKIIKNAIATTGMNEY